ncbi:hypothetical protein ACFHNC_23310 [Falsiroseomonas sp. E2-1-a4]
MNSIINQTCSTGANTSSAECRDLYQAVTTTAEAPPSSSSSTG